MTSEDLRKEFKDMQGFWDGYHFEKSKVSEQVYAYIQWLENRVVKNCSISDVVGQSEQCRHDNKTITDEDGFEVCHDCAKSGENC